MRRAWIYISLLFTIGACSLFKFQGDFFPNMRGEFTEESGGDSTIDYTQDSRIQAQNLQKNVLWNLPVLKEVVDATGWNPQKNCVQLVQLRSDAIVVDFANVSCPTTAYASVSASSIQLTASYRYLFGKTYELQQAGRPIGRMVIDTENRRLYVESLCSGNYWSSCYLSTDNGRVDGILVF